jgi:hypothetical protein
MPVSQVLCQKYKCLTAADGEVEFSIAVEVSSSEVVGSLDETLAAWWTNWGYCQVSEAAAAVAPFDRQQAKVVEPDGKVCRAVASEIGSQQLVGTAQAGRLSRDRANAREEPGQQAED